MRFLNIVTCLFCLYVIITGAFNFIDLNATFEIVKNQNEFYSKQIYIVMWALIFFLIIIVWLYSIVKKMEKLQVFLSALTILFSIVMNISDGLSGSVTISDEIVNGKMIDSSH